LPVNLKFAIEGEEESGSESLRPFLESYREALAADTVLICDTSMIDAHTPAITRSLRGMAYAQVQLRSATRDMHSGEFGGAVVNVLHVLGHLIAAFHDGDHHVAIPGFYDDVDEPSDEDRREVSTQPFTESSWRESAGGSPPCTETGYTIAEATALRPCLDINGVWGGYAGDGAKTVIPGSAGLKVSARLVARQDPQDIFRKIDAFVRSHVPDGVEVNVTPLGFGNPLTVPTDSRAIAATSTALEETFGRPPVMYRGGGSIPAAALFGNILGLDATMMGFGLKSDNIHAPNEHLGLGRFAHGIESVIRFLVHYAGAGQTRSHAV